MVCYYELPARVEEFASDSGFHLRAEAGTIPFSIPTAGYAQLVLYDPTGRLVSAPIDGFTGAGEHAIVLDLDRDMYFAALRYKGGIETLKLVW
ncbi:MAG: T9SS type A sorting domain-containing protein [Candidatus Eisenbacteria sp.]|nr:T9SS type A sorting domain-containing protein [Candidatus Eisenbacteria bacterium]